MKRIITMMACLCSLSAMANTDTRIIDCSKLTNDSDRLACYDRIAASLTTPVEQASADNVVTKQVIPPEVATNTTTNQAQPATADRFGLEHKRTEQEKATDDLTMTISKVKARAYDEWILWFENGQQWQTVSSSRSKFKVGQEVVISRGVFNSFSLSIKGQNRSVKVKRIK
ncbi:hypothetical protein [Thalassotalea maritima]|uniref:hypothetical protein n=1 Tax=Thalassotalea maritima TaxID=3242416 RepID=UPI003528C74F